MSSAAVEEKNKKAAKGATLEREPAATGNDNTKGTLARLAGTVFVYSSVIAAVFTGIQINLIQVLIRILDRLSPSESWRIQLRRFNGLLIWLLLSPTICVLYYWNNAKLRLYLADKRFLAAIRRSQISLAIPNHSFQIDGLFFIMFGYCLGNLGQYKTFSKDALKYLPVFGWAAWLSDFLFVKRAWHKDQAQLSKQLSRLATYRQLMLALLAEGTRLTPENRQQAVEFMEARGEAPFKHHLAPRTRGFIATCRHFLRPLSEQESSDRPSFAVYNLEMIAHESYGFQDIINGRDLECDIYLEEATLTAELADEAARSKDEDGCPKLARFLYDLFRRKDELVDEYHQLGGRFKVDPNKGLVMLCEGRLSASIGWLISMTYTYGILVYLATVRYADSAGFWSLLAGLALVCGLLVKRIASETKRLKPITK